MQTFWLGLFMLLSGTALAADGNQHATLIQLACRRAQPIPVKMEWALTNASIRYSSVDGAPAGTVNFLFKVRSQKTGKMRTLRSTGIFEASPEFPAFWISQIAVEDERFSLVELALSKNPAEGAIGRLWLKGSSEPIGGGILSCLKY